MSAVKKLKINATNGSKMSSDSYFELNFHSQSKTHAVTYLKREYLAEFEGKVDDKSIRVSIGELASVGDPFPAIAGLLNLLTEQSESL